MGLNFSLLNYLLHQEIFVSKTFIHQSNLKLLEIGKLKNTLNKQQKIFLSNNYNIPKKILDSDPRDIYNFFGFTQVASLDKDKFEGATILKNLNIPPNIDNNDQNLFDLVIDGGTSEHVYNPIIAFSNYVSMLKINGHLVQILPANNYIDHGIYQFSPTFFYSINLDNLKLQNLHFVERKNKPFNYWDANSDYFKHHVHGTYDGSAFANLFRFKSGNIVALANWVKLGMLDDKKLIYEMDQEIYRSKWNKKSKQTVAEISPLYEKIIKFIYVFRSEIIKIIVGRIVLICLRRKY